MAMKKIVKLKRKQEKYPNTFANTEAPPYRFSIQSITRNNSLQSTSSDVQMPKSITIFPNF